jgi:hypothetical protein
VKEEQHAARCTLCREEAPRLGGRLRSLTVQPMSGLERDRAWVAIAAGTRPRVSRVATVLGRLCGVGRRRPIVGWVAAAAAVLLVLAPLHLGFERQVVSQAQLNAQTVIDVLDAPQAASVFVFETPEEKLSIIWVIESEAPENPR